MIQPPFNMKALIGNQNNTNKLKDPSRNIEQNMRLNRSGFDDDNWITIDKQMFQQFKYDVQNQLDNLGIIL